MQVSSQLKTSGIATRKTAPAGETSALTTGTSPSDSVELGSPLQTAVPKPMRPPADPNKRDWRDDLIYFVITDRFQDGDTSNNQGVDKTDLNHWQGGDLQGLIDRADYIRDTGATAVWVTPPMLNAQNIDTGDGKTADGYHGYWPLDMKAVDPHQGSLEKFREMIGAMHDRGIKVIIDMPLNHLGYGHPWEKDPDKQDWFHHNGNVTDWENDWQQENCAIFGLPDLAQENPKVRDYLIDVGKFWAGQGVDGMRLDAVRSVPRAFWKEFDQQMHEVLPNGFLVGEFFHGDPNRIAPLQREDRMDSLMDYPLYYRMKDAFAHDQSMRELANGVAQFNSAYAHPEMMAVFPDNHDVTRFLTEANGDKNKLKMALAFAMTVNRIPTIYYATEQSMTNDPNGGMETARKNMDFQADPEMHKYFQTLASIRNDCEPLRRGELLEMWQDEKVYAYDRKSDHGEAIVVLNNDGGTQSRDIPLRAESHLHNGSKLKDMISGHVVEVRDGRLHTELGAKTAAIYVPVE